MQSALTGGEPARPVGERQILHIRQPDGTAHRRALAARDLAIGGGECGRVVLQKVVDDPVEGRVAGAAVGREGDALIFRARAHQHHTDDDHGDAGHDREPGDGAEHTQGQGRRELPEQAGEYARSRRLTLPPLTVVPARRLDAVRELQLREDLGDMVLGAVAGDTQSFADLLVRQALANEGENLPLARRKLLLGPAA